MVRYIPPNSAAVHVDHYRTGFGDPDYTIPAGDLISFRMSERAGNKKGEGELVIDNDDYTYTTDDARIAIGDSILFLAGTASRTEDPNTSFGVGKFGLGGFGYDPVTRWDVIGSFRVTDWQVVEHAPGQSDLVLKVADFVFETLSMRFLFNKFTDQPLSGSEDAVLNTVLRDKCPEIDRSLLPSIPDEISYTSSGKHMTDVVDDLATMATEFVGPVVQSSSGTALIFEPLEDLIDDRVTDEPFPDGTFGAWQTTSESHNLHNYVRVTGGVDDEGNIDDQQETVDAYVQVSETNRLTHQISTRKSELTQLQIWTRGDGSSADGLRVRLQRGNADNTAPIEVGDTRSDYINSGPQKVALSSDGWRRFNLGDHTITTANPWLIIDSTGQDGYEVGVNSSGVPAFRAYFPKPVISELSDTSSINEFGRREQHIRNEALDSVQEIRQRLSGHLERHRQPDVVVGPLECLSDDAHALNVGDVIPLDQPQMRATGNFVVTEKSKDYEQNQLTESVTLAGASTYA